MAATKYHFDLVGENVYPLFYQSWIAGGYVDVQSHLVSGTLPGESFSLEVAAKNIGLELAENVAVEVSADDPSIGISPTLNYGDIIARERADNAGNPFLLASQLILLFLLLT